MCDTILAPPGSTAQHIMLFGKNSDRQRNEAQAVEYFPSADHAPDAQLTCTYITIPQVRHTHAVLLSRPFWSWGAEMGANEYGVVIGNEAVHARSAPSEQKELPGMDLLRLALERAATAAEALDVITALLKQHGQGGNCGHLTPNYYNNGFLIADRSDAFVLETLGREWLVERVRGVRAISNVYSIGRDAERVSAGLSTLIRDFGWSEEAAPHYADVIASPNREHIGHARARRARSTALLQSHAGQLGVANMMRILRDHGATDRSHSDWHPERSSAITLCMHAGAEDHPGQTAGSWVSELHEADAVHWVTGTAAPCTSIFKPLFMDAPPPAQGPRPTDRIDSRTLWWRHERLHRAALLHDFGKFLNDISRERDALEADFRARVKAVINGSSAAERLQVVTDCWKEAVATEDRWSMRLNRTTTPNDSPYRTVWREMNQLAGLDASF
jgi:secernin